MLSGSFAHNDLTGMGRIGDFATHRVEHELSALYGVTHGAGIAVISIAWMKYVYEKKLPLFVYYAENVWDVPDDFGSDKEIAFEGITRLKDFFRKIGVPVNLKELGLPDNASEYFELMAEKCSGEVPQGNLVKIYKNDALEILKTADKEL